MALSLNAEQKPLLKIFKIEDQYIIPSYQRPYSWKYEQCLQLYNDVVENFKPFDEQNKALSPKDYFLGNIIIAKNEENRDLIYDYYVHCNLGFNDKNFETTYRKITKHKKGQKVKRDDMLEYLINSNENCRGE